MTQFLLRGGYTTNAVVGLGSYFMKKNHIIILFLHVLMSCFLLGTNIPAIAADRSESQLQSFLSSHGYEEVPLRLSKDKNFLLIEISFGNEQLPFILDTGAAQTSIDKKIQEKYKFKKHGKIFMTGGTGGNYFRTYEVIVPKMQLGSFITFNQPGSIQHYSRIKVDEQPIGGMIGLNFLRKYQAVLDMPHLRLFLKPQSGKSMLNLEIPQNTLVDMGYEPIQLKRSSSGHQTLLVKIDDADPVRMMLDTGAAPILIDSEYAKSIAVKNKGDMTIGKGSSAGAMKMFNAQVEKITIGLISSSPQEIIITTGLEQAEIGIPIMGSIGLNWMLLHQTVLDVTNDVVFAKHP